MDTMNREVNQFGEKSLYIENAGDIYLNSKDSSLTKEQIIENFNSASIDLSSYKNTFGDKIQIDRNETTLLFNWIVNELPSKESNIAILSGGAGYGKSVILKDLFEKLKNENIPVLGIKADKLSIHSVYFQQ